VPRLPTPVTATARALHVLAVLVVCWWAFAFRFARPDFVNDDFDHLSKARQVLAGELPERDFYDDGRPLTIYASAVVQAISPTLLSELIFRAGAIAIGVSVVFVLARALSQSTLLGLLAALLTIAMRPRLYNYPKVLIFPAVLWVLWRYIDRPTRGGLVQLAVFTVVAFLFRYDFGVYVALVVGFTLLWVHRARALPALAVYAGVGLVCCAPYLMWLAAQGRLLPAGSGGTATLLERMPGIVRPRVHMDLSRGLFSFGAPQAEIGVRWSADTDIDTRRALEERFGLHERELKSDGRSGSYLMDNPAPERIRLLLHDEHIEDTSGIDRGNSRLEDAPLTGSWSTWIPQLRLTVFPTRADAMGWIYYVFVFSVPLAVLTLWLVPDERVAHGSAKVLSLALMCAVLHQFLVLGVLDSRLPEITGVTAVLLAWLAARAVEVFRRMSGAWGRIARVSGATAATVLALLTWLSVSLYSGASIGSILGAGLVAPSALADVSHRLGARPIDYWTNDSSTGLQGLTRYIGQCLGPDDRALIVSYAPEVFYFSGKRFAGGMNKFDPNGLNPTGAQILRRLGPQSVPVVVVDEGAHMTFEGPWEDLGRYLTAHYQEVAVTGFGDERRTFHVLVESARRPVRTEPRWNLPCFAG
jgi:hypothetical protein